MAREAGESLQGMRLWPEAPSEQPEQQEVQLLVGEKARNLHARRMLS